MGILGGPRHHRGSFVSPRCQPRRRFGFMLAWVPGDAAFRGFWTHRLRTSWLPPHALGLMALLRLAAHTCCTVASSASRAG
jgi:hypothetical protein